MRKYLLFVFAAIGAISVNAQKIASIKTASVEQLQQKVVNRMTANQSAVMANVNKAAKAPALNNVVGNYIEDNNLNFHECSAATITLDEKDSVVITFDDGYATVKGWYDPATGIINCRAQLCGSYTNTQTKTSYYFAIYGISELNLEEGKLNLTEDLSFTVNDDKSITLDQLGYILIIVDSDDKDAIDKTWNWHTETMLMPVNAIQAGYTNGRSTGNQWAEYSIPVAVEDFDFSVNVYGFCNYGCLAIDINEDGTVSIPTGQPMLELGLEEDQAAIYGEYLSFYGVDLTADGGIQTNTDKPAVVGTIEGNTITISEYFRLCSLFDSEGSGYAENWYADNTTITLNDGSYIAGIQNVNGTREEMVKNTKTYNLMGQQVERATKGIVVRNGKKYLNK